MENPTLQELVDMQAEFEKKIAASGEDAIKLECKKFFDDHPEILAIRWTQYTPTFNDGDPCVFSVSEPMFKFRNEEDDEDEYLEDGFQHVYRPEIPAYKDCQALCNLFTEAETVLELVFGDNVTVTVTREAIRIEDYYDY